MLQSNTDYTLEFIYDSVIASIYVNGVIEASVHETFEFDTTIAQIQIGAWPPDFPGDWDSLICPMIGSVIMKHRFVRNNSSHRI